MFSLLRVLLAGVVLASPAWAATKPTIASPTAVPGANGSVTFGARGSAQGALTGVVFEYGLTNGYGERTAPIFLSAAETQTVPVSTTATGLFGGQTYHFRARATNSEGSAMTADATFLVPAYRAVATILKPSGLKAGSITFKGRVRPNGQAGVAVFEFSQDAFAADIDPSPQSWTLTGLEKSVDLETTVTGLERGKGYSVRVAFSPSAGAPVYSGSETFTTNQPPVAVRDVFTLASREPAALDVRKNDRDPDGDPLVVVAATGSTKGTVSVTTDGTSVVYVPGANFTGTDTFTYTVRDGFVEVTGNVTVRAFGVLLRGNQGGVIEDKDGNPVGYLKLKVTESGLVTGTVVVNGAKRSFTGSFGSDGVFRSSVEIDGERIPLSLTATNESSGTSVQAKLGDGRWSAGLRTTEASAADRKRLAGRYTVEFPNGTSTSNSATSSGDPNGTGWAALKLGEDGIARVRGRLPDGRSFSTTGLLGSARTGSGAVITFFDDPSRTRVAGELTVGATLSGALVVQRDSGGSGNFADGYELQRTASGARYVPPGKGESAIAGDGRTLTFAVTEGAPGENFSKQIRVSDRDRVTVINGEAENLKVKIDRDSGRFTAQFTGATDDDRIRGTGVFIQSGTAANSLGRGAGVFTGREGTGRITISAGTSGTGTSGTGTTNNAPTVTTVR